MPIYTISISNFQSEIQRAERQRQIDETGRNNQARTAARAASAARTASARSYASARENTDRRRVNPSSDTNNQKREIIKNLYKSTKTKIENMENKKYEEYKTLIEKMKETIEERKDSKNIQCLITWDKITEENQGQYVLIYTENSNKEPIINLYIEKELDEWFNYNPSLPHSREKINDIKDYYFIPADEIMKRAKKIADANESILKAPARPAVGQRPSARQTASTQEINQTATVAEAPARAVNRTAQAAERIARPAVGERPPARLAAEKATAAKKGLADDLRKIFQDAYNLDDESRKELEKVALKKKSIQQKQTLNDNDLTKIKELRDSINKFKTIIHDKKTAARQKEAAEAAQKAKAEAAVKPFRQQKKLVQTTAQPKKQPTYQSIYELKTIKRELIEELRKSNKKTLNKINKSTDLTTVINQNGQKLIKNNQVFIINPNDIIGSVNEIKNIIKIINPHT